MNSVFSIFRLDEINLKKYGIAIKNYYKDVKKMLDIMLEMPELKSSKVFRGDINKIRFEISFCNNETIREINKNYREKDAPTDVITFSLFCDDENALVYRNTADLGQIVVSIEKADEQKDENKNTLRYEILTLICHGILHLFGFDHLEKKDYDFVVGIQKKVIAKL